MASPGKRKRVRADESLITDFLDLRDSSIVQTGPKRPRGGGVIPLTPAVRTPLPQRRQRGIPGRPNSSSRDARKKTPLTATVRDLIESAAEVSALTPGPSTRTTLTPTPARTPRRSPRLSVLETSANDRRVLRSALKRVHPLSSLRKSGREGDSRVSFGDYVTIKEYSPDYGGEDILTSVERSGAGSRVLEPLEEEGSEEEEEGGESEGSEVGEEKEEGSSASEEEEGAGESGGGVVGGEKEEGAGESVVGGEYGSSEEEGGGESRGGVVGSGSEEEGGGESGGGMVGGEYGGSEEEGGGESGGGVVGSEEEGRESEGDDVGSGSEAEERSEEEGGKERLKTPHQSSLKAGRMPQLTTPAYSDFRPVRKSRPTPVRSRAPTKQPGNRKRRPAKTLPRSLIKNLFTLFCKKRVTKDAMDLIVKFTEVYLKHASDDLVVFARHAGRKTIEVQDVTLLLGRQRHISDSQGFEYLVNTYLPLEYVEELLPCAVAGKRIVPRMKS